MFLKNPHKALAYMMFSVASIATIAAQGSSAQGVTAQGATGQDSVPNLATRGPAYPGLYIGQPVAEVLALYTVAYAPMGSNKEFNRGFSFPGGDGYVTVVQGRGRLALLFNESSLGKYLNQTLGLGPTAVSGGDQVIVSFEAGIVARMEVKGACTFDVEGLEATRYPSLSTLFNNVLVADEIRKWLGLDGYALANSQAEVQDLGRYREVGFASQGYKEAIYNPGPIILRYTQGTRTMKVELKTSSLFVGEGKIHGLFSEIIYSVNL